MSKVEFPDWAKPGTPVLIGNYRYGRASYRVDTVTRLTATRIVVDDRQYVQNRRGQWREYGVRNDMWTTPDEIIPADSDKGVSIRTTLRRAELKVAVQGATDEFRFNPTHETAAAAIAALQAWDAEA